VGPARSKGGIELGEGALLNFNPAGVAAACHLEPKTRRTATARDSADDDGFLSIDIAVSAVTALSGETASEGSETDDGRVGVPEGEN